MRLTEFSYANITTATTTVVKAAPGVLHSIVVNKAANGTIAIHDAVTATTPVIGTMKASIVEGTYLFDVKFTTGLTIVTGAATDITVTYA
jgi:hypothetical protein